MRRVEAGGAALYISLILLLAIYEFNGELRAFVSPVHDNGDTGMSLPESVEPRLA